MGRISRVLAALKPGRKGITPRVPFFPAKKKKRPNLPRTKFEATPISNAKFEATPISNDTDFPSGTREPVCIKSVQRLIVRPADFWRLPQLRH
jgi:hypothetical protein